jgi:predicted TIM-barrel fold metal-dependent hydrolase
VTVDAHTHLLPQRLAVRVRAFFDAHMAGPLAYPVDHDAVLAALAADGIDELWTLPYAHKPGMAAALNQAMAGIAAAGGPVKVLAGATVHPGDDDPAGLVRAAVLEHGLRALKLHCSVGDYRADDPGLDPVWAYAAEVALPVVVHVGHAVSGHTEAAELEPVVTVATRHPGAVLIIAHCAAPSVDAALDLVEAHPNVYADLVPVVTRTVPLPPARAEALAGKLLFGSDAPSTAVPAGEALAALRDLGLSGEALTEITGGTARRLQDAVRA